MTKRNRIIYWIATIWLCLGMLSSGIVQLIKFPKEVENMTRLGYPSHFLTVIGVWKILGVIVLLGPKFPLVKEWAYAGFFFIASGAVVAHLAGGDAAKEFFGPVLLMVLTVVSWHLRPPNRKLITKFNHE